MTPTTQPPYVRLSVYLTLSFYLVLSFLVLCLSFGLQAQAAIYKTTDDNGIPLFTDKLENTQGKEAQTLERKLVSTIPSAHMVRELSTTKKRTSSSSPNYTVQLISPRNDAVIHKGNGTVSLAASVQPNLKAGDYVTLTVDDKPVGDALATSIDLTTMNRGMHVAEVKVFSRSGRLIGSDKANFYVYQHSAMFRKNQNKKPSKERQDPTRRTFKSR